MSDEITKVRASKQRFYDIQTDLLNSKHHNFENNLNIFVDFCESDPVMTAITRSLKDEKSIDVEKWHDDFLKTGGSMVGSKHYTLPPDPFQQASLLYQFILGIQSGKYNFYNFTIGVYGTTRLDEAIYEFVNDIVRKLLRYLNRALDQIETGLMKPVIEAPKKDEVTPKVFLVHGHDKDMLEAVELLIHQIGLEPIVLGEQIGEGQTIIEKFEKHSDVSHAIILLSPDDKGYKATNFPSDAMFRARQNVILELGYFTGKLGRKSVTVVHKKCDDFEMPSDYHGVEYIPLDEKDVWKRKLASELEGAGFKVNYSRIS